MENGKSYRLESNFLGQIGLERIMRCRIIAQDRRSVFVKFYPIKISGIIYPNGNMNLNLPIEIPRNIIDSYVEL